MRQEAGRDAKVAGRAARRRGVPGRRKSPLRQVRDMSYLGKKLMAVLLEDKPVTNEWATRESRARVRQRGSGLDIDPEGDG